MEKYSTGELARLCGVSVRTVQYYDTRGLLSPSELSEGGRRLYSPQDLEKMKVICFLRSAGLSISSIGEIAAQGNSEETVLALVEKQKKELEEQVQDCQKKISLLEGIRKNLKEAREFSPETLGDVASIVKNQGSLKRLHRLLLATGIPFCVIQWTSVLLWILQGIWWPFALYTALYIPYAVWIISYYRKRVLFLCPQCHSLFRPAKKEFLFSPHTRKARRVTCPGCGYRGYCLETGAPEI